MLIHKNKYSLVSGYDLIVLEQVKSTMITAKEMALKEKDSIGKIIWAKNQTEGRGRHGKLWVSPPGNLYFSFIRQNEKEKNGSLFAPVFITSLSLAESIEDISKKSLKPFLKWPNDLLINRSKLAGILIEKFLNNNKEGLLNIGVGVNINSSPKNIEYETTHLKKENIRITPRDVLLCFFHYLSINEELYKNRGFKNIIEKWKKYSHKVNETLVVKTADRNFEGMYKGIDSSGALVIKLHNGNLKTFYTGEIFL